MRVLFEEFLARAGGNKNWSPPALALMALAITSCVSPPDTYVVGNQRTYQRPYDNVWQDLMGFFIDGRLQIKTADKAGGIVYAENLSYSGDEFADCGDPGLTEDVVGGSAALNVFVEPPRQGITGTRVTINTTFMQRREDSGHTRTVDCNSTGLLEKNFLDYLDNTEAVRSLRGAAEQGDAEAQHRLGVKYQNGQGVPRDYSKAIKWYRMAVEQGHSGTMNNIGVMYYQGRGMPQDDVRAHLWFSLAAAEGDEHATKNRDKLTKRMTRGQIADAQRLAREWKAKKQ